MPKKPLTDLKPQKKFAALLFIILLSAITGFLVFRHIFSFLAVTHRKPADTLVIEGWIPKSNIRLALREFQQHSYKKIIITSILLPPEFNMYSRGSLIFDLTEDRRHVPEQVKEVMVMAYSTALEDLHAQFTLIVNDSVVGKATTRGELASYPFNLNHFQEPARKIVIRYDNDAHTQEEDRNLYVKSLLVDGKLIPVRSPYVTYDLGKIDGKKLVRTDLFSEAEEAQEVLLEAGLPDSAITVINASAVQFDRTYHSAKAVRHWMEKHHESFPSFNIFTESVHARRTRMLYDLAFQRQAEIGIIASPSPDFTPKNWWKNRAGRRFVTEQLFKYLYAKFLFYPS